MTIASGSLTFFPVALCTYCTFQHCLPKISTRLRSVVNDMSDRHIARRARNNVGCQESFRNPFAMCIIWTQHCSPVLEIWDLKRISFLTRSNMCVWQIMRTIANELSCICPIAGEQCPQTQHVRFPHIPLRAYTMSMHYHTCLAHMQSKYR